MLDSGFDISSPLEFRDEFSEGLDGIYNGQGDGSFTCPGVDDVKISRSTE